MKSFLSLVLRATIPALLAANAIAQGFPAKPVRLVVPFPPGGSSDAVGRVIGERSEEHTSKLQSH